MSEVIKTGLVCDGTPLKEPLKCGCVAQGDHWAYMCQKHFEEHLSKK